MTYLTVPIAAKDLTEAKAQTRSALACRAEMLELRTDYLTGLTVGSFKALLAQTRAAAGPDLPVIVTCRDPREGGLQDYPQNLRIDVLVEAIDAGAELVDCEYANFVAGEIGPRLRAALAERPGTRLILSAHDFTGPFPNLRRLHADVIAACPESIPKMAYRAGHINDCFEAFDLLHDSTGDTVVLCMGEPGLISRILARKLGGFVTFGSIEPESATAPGQLAAAELKGLYRHDRIDTETELFGVIACPVGHSMSPAIHNACFAEQGMNRLYLPLLVEGGRGQLFDFFDNVLARPWLTFGGFSVTIPHKHGTLEYVRERGGFVEPLAEQIGAVNTVIVDRRRVGLAPPSGPGPQRTDSAYAGRSRATGDEPRLAACNTDYTGALDAITAGMGIERADLRAVPVAVVGAGGVSRAIVAGLRGAGARVKIYNRTVERAERLAADFDCEFAGLDDLPNLDARLVVNCTSIGMYPRVDRSPVPAGALKPGMAVFDTVYNPAETLLLKQAKAAGAKTIDGIAMFVNQAAAQFQLFTGHPANTNLMREVVVRRPH